MTQEQEQEAFSLVLERQKNGASENDIRTAFPALLGNSRRSCRV